MTPHRRLNPSLAYALTEIDEHLSSSRNEGEARLAPLRTALRSFASSVACPALVDPQSDSSFGALLAGKRSAVLGAAVLENLLSTSSANKARVCLVSATARLLNPEQADQLTEDERVQCIPVAGTDKLAQRFEGFSSRSGHVVATVPKAIAGGARDGTLDVERVRPNAVKISIVSASGMRKNMTSGDIPSVILDRLFGDIESDVPKFPPSVVQMRSNELPNFLRLSLVDFLERRVRLQVLCTAAQPAPVSRPVALERAYLRETEQLAVRAYLHKTSASCLCEAHGKFFNVPGAVEVNLETCGRALVRGEDGCMRCPCHISAVDSRGNARFSIDGMCTECTKMSIVCLHREGSVCRKGVCIDTLSLNDADRRELATILVATDEFVGRTTQIFSKRVCNNPAKLAQHIQVLEERFKMRMQSVERDQLEREDPSVRNPRSLLQRDMVAVDLIRGGGVFRHVVKRGDRRGHPYLARAKRTADTQPLAPHESELVDTHGHLFRKAA